ncbi:MAG: hypothetical protein K2H09_03625 [Treponemataceae bacterium]|nr:hypothetical protein [Treponemataceae bacterium]
MCDSNEPVKQDDIREAYFDKMGIPFCKVENENTDSNENVQDSKQMLALEKAHDIRKFEIELFWKRGTYFWAFILASYTAYFFTLSFNKENLFSSEIIILVLLCVTSFLGFFFSYSWLLVNKGSKYWQKNWELHIDCLEQEITGNLHKTFLDTAKNGCESSPFSVAPYDYSVSKVTTIGSLVMTVLGFCIFAMQLFFTVGALLSVPMEIHLAISLAIVVFLCLGIAAMTEWLKGNVHSSNEIHFIRHELGNVAADSSNSNNGNRQNN